MSQTGTVNYHIHKSHRQAFEIDAGGEVGRLISPELVETEVTVRDVRTGEASVSFQNDSLALFHAPSTLNDFAAEGWEHAYEAELTDLLQRELLAREVVIFEHTIREDDPASDRKPARNVHSDYSPDGAEARLTDLLGAEKAADWASGHFAFINIWRPVGAAINSAPLGFVRPSSVAAKDWMLIDLIYPDRKGQIMGLAANAKHEWLYQSKMTPDEVAVFNIYDNRGLPSIGHSAIDLIEDPSVHSVRKSIETRTLVRY